MFRKLHIRLDQLQRSVRRRVFQELHRDAFEDLHDLGVTIVVITHDRDIAARMDRRIDMRDGQIISDSREDPQP